MHAAHVVRTLGLCTERVLPIAHWPSRSSLREGGEASAESLTCLLCLPPSVLVVTLQGGLKLLYTSRCKKYEQGGSLEATLEALENEPPNGQQQQQQAGGGGAAAAAGGQQQQFQQQQIAGPSGDGASSSSLQTPDKGRPASAGPQPMALSPVQEEPSAGSSGGSSAAAAAGGAAAAPAAPGWGLSDNLDVIACRAEWLYHRCPSHLAVCSAAALCIPACSPRSLPAAVLCYCWKPLLSCMLRLP